MWFKSVLSFAFINRPWLSYSLKIKVLGKVPKSGQCDQNRISRYE